MSTKSPIKAVVFDIDGTLCSFDTPLGHAYAEVLAVHGIPVQPSLIDRSLKRVWEGFQSRYLNTPEQHRTSEERERLVWFEFATKVLEDAGISCVGRDHIVEDIYRSFSRPQGRIVEPGARECLAALRESGISAVAATNNDSRTKDVLDALGLLSHLDAVFVAAELSWKKPSRRYFQEIGDRLGIPAASILHVGNHVDLDVIPAHESGWSAILYDPKGRGRDPRIASLMELLPLVKRS